MIKRTQRRIAILSISLLFVLLLVVYGVTFSQNKKDLNDRIINKLSAIENNYSMHLVSLLDDYLVIQVSVNPVDNSNHYYILQNNGLSLDAKLTQNIVDKAVEKSFFFGDEDGDIYYKYNNVNNILIVYDATSLISAFNHSQYRIAMMYAIIFAVLIVIALILSYKIIQPIEETYFKQQKFISDASHELKTPVAVISANADVLLTQEKSEYLDNIKSQTDRMKCLVSDMLTLSKTEEQPQIEKENFSLSDEVVKVLLAFDAVAFEKGKFLEFDVPKGYNYFGDRKGINTILTILIDNAIKYADKESKIFVCLKKEKNKYSISVFNKGSQIPDEDSNRIFERFYRGDFSRSRDSGGSGLGLSIAYSIAQNNKWKLTAKSKLNDSMIVTLTI